MIVGVIEGFYGPPWSLEARLECIDLLAAGGGTHYVWAAKLEPRHRSRWNEAFTVDELAGFAALAQRSPAVALAVALTPGSAATSAEVVAKLRPAVEAGAQVMVLAFDDLPVLDAGAQHAALAAAVRMELGTPLWVVPTHYAGTTSSPYLDALCAGLPDDVLVMWTGDAVVTDSISLDDAAARAGACGGRMPLLWDNVPVNDAIMEEQLRIGPLTGRDPGLRDQLAGVLWNPMLQPRASLLPLTSCLAWARGEDPIEAWERDAHARGWRAFADGVSGAGPGLDDRPALRSWLDSLATVDAPGIELEVAPWLAAVRAEAAVGVQALDLLDEVAARQGRLGVEAVITAAIIAAGWRRVRTAGVSVFGGRMIVEPRFTQDDRGQFCARAGWWSERDTIVDRLVREALDAICS